MITEQQQKDIDNVIALLVGTIDEAEHAFSFSDVEASRKYDLLYDRLMLVKTELAGVLQHERISIHTRTKLLDAGTADARFEVAAYRHRDEAA